MPNFFFILCCALAANPVFADKTTPRSGLKGAQHGGVKKIVCLGDSVTEGYGLSKDQAFPALIEKKLSTPKQRVEVVNAGISGSTSASGLSRLKWLLKAKPDLILLELGGNDGLRGQDPAATKKNLGLMIDEAKKANAKVVLIAVKLPPNFGEAYREAFAKVFTDTAKEKNIPLIPFLDDFFATKSLVQADGLHPNAEGHAVIADKLAKALEPHL